MNSLTFPSPLKPGDDVALLTPSSPAPEDVLKKAVKSLEYIGLHPHVMKSCRSSCGYLAGTDTERAYDIQEAFSCDDIHGIFCLRGGYGAARILPMLDFKEIKKHPKVFVGYSDITALHTAINKLCGLTTFHGPMPCDDYESMDTFSLASLISAVFSPGSLISSVFSPDSFTPPNTFQSKAFTSAQLRYGKHLMHNPPGSDLISLASGCAEGILTGGNLSVLASTLGSPYEIDTNNRILFLEDINEEAYRLDRAFTALSLAGKFRDCSGIILGSFANCGSFSDSLLCYSNGTQPSVNTMTNAILDILLRCKKPILLGLCAGHEYPQLTLPLGARVSLTATDDEKNICVL